MPMLQEVSENILSARIETVGSFFHSTASISETVAFLHCFHIPTVVQLTIQYNTENFYSTGILGVAKFKGA